MSADNITVGSIEKTCYFWNKTGQCKHGTKCNFLHRDTPIIADPPKSWIDYGDKGPPLKATRAPRVQSNIRDNSEDGNSREKVFEPNHKVMEDELDWEHHIPANEWDQQSSASTRVNVTEWYPPKANGTHSVTASTSASNKPATPVQHADFTETPTVIGDLWETLLPIDFTEYRDLRKKYAMSDPEFDVNALVLLLAAEPFQLSDVEQYLGGYSDQDIYLDKASRFEKLPPIFFAVATNEPKALKLLIARGISVDANAGPDNIPLLAFAIMHGSRADTTEMVRILLASGADPTHIPDEFISFDHYSSSHHRFSRSSNSEIPSWLSEKYRFKLASTINISQRYWLLKARGLRPRTDREHLIARMERCPNLFQMPFCLVGQSFATSFLMRRVLSHLLLSKSNVKPLVVAFVGPSGHGKTELAKSMRTCLSAAFLTINCAEMTSTADLFGSTAPSPGYEQGSALNNFLCRNHGQRCIVFLDEFEKMGPAVHESLLTPFDEGIYRDRRAVRNDTKIDCSKVIWILATSKVDNIIEPYYRANVEAFQNPDNQDQQLLANIMNEIESKFLRKFSIELGTTFAGRISMVLPFLPFSPAEQAVIAHKYLLELKRTLAADVNKETIMGHIKLEVEGEAAVCRHIAENGYEIEYGARSIEREMHKSVRDAITQEWLGSTDWIPSQRKNGPYERYLVSLDPAKEHVVVCKILDKKGRTRARQNRTSARPAAGQGGSQFESSVGVRSGTPSSVGGMRSLRVGRLIDIELVNGWEE
ncbi:uncharacterized protein LAJ45_10751 [Morchella importuna]|uniref:uncharacterized protein n=1 Tax=Morchella importuna TaxID=1174673 RepID=UPI001E8D95CB|nr:uncharacterized protein LAJ45_10751 [Morchella importuna]KAH8145191.1 hypothetical protein LAJ45_10751 [Morchella importuna]